MSKVSVTLVAKGVLMGVAMLLWQISCTLPQVKVQSSTIEPDSQQAILDVQQRLGSGFIVPIPGDEEWQIYRNPTYGYEIKYPRTWVARPLMPYGEEASFSAPIQGNQQFGASYSIYQPPREASFILPEIFEQWYARHRVRQSGEYTIQEEMVIVDGLRGLKVTYRYKEPGRVEIEGFIPVPDDREGRRSGGIFTVYVFGCGGSGNDSDIQKYLDVCEKMLSSLRFFKRATDIGEGDKR